METFEKEKSGFAQELQQRQTKPTMDPGIGVATHVGHSTSMWQGNQSKLRDCIGWRANIPS